MLNLDDSVWTILTFLLQRSLRKVAGEAIDDSGLELLIDWSKSDR